jgi:hypothetical protein
MVTALEAGVDLPPVIVNSADMRVIDGFHRLKAHIKVFGSDSNMTVDMRVYESEADMFQDSVRYNSQHGLPLTPKDRAHALIKARKFKIPYSAMAAAMGMTEANVNDFLAKRTAKTQSGETVALSYGASEFAGKTLTPEQEHFNNHATGSKPIMYAAMLVNALEAEALPLDERACAKLKELYDIIGGVLDGACHE